MSKLKKKIVGNWKMNGLCNSYTEVEKLINNYKKNIYEVTICPPYTLLFEFIKKFKKSGIKFGSQNSSQFESGAYTGEISVEMLKDIGVHTVIVGHSERRKFFNENDIIIKEKLNLILNNSLEAILCVGETLDDRLNKKTSDVVNSQIVRTLSKNQITKKLSIAYEPLWAIGSGKTPSSGEINEVHGSIYTTLKKEFGESFSKKVSILYGGSVSQKNSKEILSLENVDGVLVGGASLKFSDFSKIMF